MQLCSVYYLTVNLTLLNPQDKYKYEKIFENILEELKTNIHKYVQRNNLFYLYKIEIGKIDLKENIYANIFFKYTLKSKIKF